MVSDKQQISINFDKDCISFLKTLPYGQTTKLVNRLVKNHLNNKPLPDIVDVIRSLDSKKLTMADAYEFIKKLETHLDRREVE